MASLLLRFTVRFVSVVARRLGWSAAVASALVLSIAGGAAAGPAPWTLTSAQPSSAQVGTTGYRTFRVAMTPPATAVGTPKGFMTVRMSTSDSPIWCFPDSGTLCFMTYAGSNLIDVHVYMSKLAAGPGTMRLQLQDPNSAQSPVYYSTVLTIPIVANAASGANAHGAVLHPVGPIQSMKPMKPILVTPAPTKT
jgi:hypothetical protein